MNLRSYWEAHREDYDALLFDIDGTLVGGRGALPGAVAFLESLRREKVPFALLTNDANHSTQEKCAIAMRGGLPTSPDEIVSSGAALKDLVAARGWAGKRFFRLGLLGRPCHGEAAGLVMTGDRHDLPECFGVLGGEEYFDWCKDFHAALNFLLRHPEAPYVVPNPDSYWQGANDTVGIGAGGQARFLCGLLGEMGAPREPIYLGKPYAPIYDCAVRYLRERFPGFSGADRKRILMVGDYLASDILGGNRNGLTSVLVLTGNSDMAAVERAPQEQRPALIFDTL